MILRRLLIVHYDEIALKGGTRSFFQGRLIRGMNAVLGSTPGARIETLYGRILVHLPDGVEGPRLADRLAALPGIAYVLEGVESGRTVEDLHAAIDDILPQGPVRSFAIHTRRADKTYPRISEVVNREAGAHVIARRGWMVDLDDPEVRVQIEITNGRVFAGIVRHEGPGGLPVGGSGKGVALLSGGIDSPVAAWMMMTRGLSLTLLHFHSAPFTTRASQDKVRELARSLARFQPRLRLVLVPFADPIQRTIVDATPDRYRVVLYRRFMMRLANAVAEDVRAACIVTGEALGQVASQTIENLTAVQAVSRLPVLRPLVGMGKRRIVELAQRVGTYEISILPHEDCCTYLMPRAPVTRSTSAELDAIEAALDVPDLVRRTWETREIETVEAAP